MPHASSDVSSNDEVKVYRVEGEGDDESSAENLKEEKRSLLTEVALKEENRGVEGDRSNSEHQQQTILHHPNHVGALPGGKHFDYFPTSHFGYVPNIHHPRGHYGPLPMVGRVPLVPSNHPPSPLSFMMYSPDQFQPPPAHMGIHIDPKTGMPRPPVFPLPPSQFHHPVFPPDYSQQYSWHHSYPVNSGFRSPPYPLALSPLIHPLMQPIPPPKTQQETHDGRQMCNIPSPSPFSNQGQQSQQKRSPRNTEKKKSHIKKPLNAFMLYMKEQRPQVVAECTLKESAAINQILGKKWHSLSREEQSKYYELARNERQMHMQRYPGWTARDNYAINAKKKKRKRDKSQDPDGNNPKKCRARFGLDRQSSWCKPCRRKKKCIRYRSGSDNTAGESEDNVGSVGSAQTPDSRYGAEEEELSDTDSGNEEDASSEFSLSSPRPPSLDRVQSTNAMPLGSPPSQQSSHPLNVQMLSQPHLPRQEQHRTQVAMEQHRTQYSPDQQRPGLASEQHLQQQAPEQNRMNQVQEQQHLQRPVPEQRLPRPPHEGHQPQELMSRTLQEGTPHSQASELHLPIRDKAQELSKPPLETAHMVRPLGEDSVPGMSRSHPDQLLSRLPQSTPEHQHASEQLLSRLKLEANEPCVARLHQMPLSEPQLRRPLQEAMEQRQLKDRRLPCEDIESRLSMPQTSTELPLQMKDPHFSRPSHISTVPHLPQPNQMSELHLSKSSEPCNSRTEQGLPAEPHHTTETFLSRLHRATEQLLPRTVTESHQKMHTLLPRSSEARQMKRTPAGSHQMSQPLQST